MEDVATAEISRAQVWSWVQAGRFDADARARRARRGSRPATRRRSCSREVALRGRVRRVPDAARVRSAAVSAREHQGRRDRADDRGGDRLRRACRRARCSARSSSRSGSRVSRTPIREALRQARGARARLLRPEPRRARADALARGAARGVPRARGAGVARDRAGYAEDDRGRSRRSSRRPRRASARRRRRCAARRATASTAGG